MPVPWATIEADPEFQALDADGQYDIASRWQEKMKAQLPTEEHDAFLEASNNRLSKYFAPKAIQAAQFSQSLLGGVTSPLGAATALASGELQVGSPQPLELAPPIPSIDQTMPPPAVVPAGVGAGFAPVAGAGTVGELLKTAKEAVSTPPWQGFGVEKIPASIILPGGAAVDLLFNSLGDSKAAQVIQGLHKAGNNQIENMANFMGSPLGVAMMGIGSLGKTAQRIVSLAFAGDMASSQPELWNRFQKATTLREKTETLADAVAGLGLTLTALKHGLTKAEKTAPAEPPPLPSPTPLTDAALGETSTRIQPKQETPNAQTQRIGQSIRPEPQGGIEGGAPETASLGDRLQRPAAGETAQEVVPTKEPAPVVQTGEAQVPVPQPAAEGQAKGVTPNAAKTSEEINRETTLANLSQAEKFKAIRDEPLKSGPPITVRIHHGTRGSPFESFDESLIGKNEPHKTGDGFYGSTQIGDAETYAGTQGSVVTGDVTINRPAPADLVKKWISYIHDIPDNVSRSEYQDIIRKRAAEMKADLIAKGYDGYLGIGTVGSDGVFRGEVVFYKPEQFKQTTQPPKEVPPSEKESQGREGQVAAESAAPPAESAASVASIQTESQRVGFNRTTPAKGTPERDALEVAWNAYDAKRSPLSEQEQKLKSEMERTTRYSNKWETLNKRRDKIIEQQSKLDQDSKAMRERIRQAYLEDRAESTNPIVALKALGDLGKAKDAYERVKAMVKEEAIKQGATPEEAEQAGIEAWMYTITEDVPITEIVRRRVEGTRMAAREAEINPFVSTLTKLERGEIRDAERELKYAAPDAKKFDALKKELTAKQEAAAKNEADARARIAREEQESRVELANQISGMTREEFLKYRDENWQRFTTAKNYFGQRKLAQEHVKSLKPETRSRVEIVGNGKTKWRVLQTYESAKAGSERILEAERKRVAAETAPPAGVPSAAPEAAPRPAEAAAAGAPKAAPAALVIKSNEIPQTTIDRLKARLSSGMDVWRGIKEEGLPPSDPGDFGVGEYHSTMLARARSYGKPKKVKLTLYNPLILTAEEAYTQIADRFGTISGISGKPEIGAGDFSPRFERSKEATEALQKMGYDGIVVLDKKGEIELVKFPDAPPAPPEAAARTTEAPAGNVAETPEIPTGLAFAAKSPDLHPTLPGELRKYSDLERADIAKALGTTDTSPEALSEALIDKFAVNKTEKPSPYPPGEVGTEARTDEIDQLVASEGSQGARIARGGPSLPTPVPGTTAVNIKGIDAIIRDLSKGLKIPIRFGRLTTTKFAGYFKQVQNLIGSRKANDIVTVSHETGHKLDNAFGLSRNPRLHGELDALGDPSSPGSLSSWTPTKSRAYRRGEGVAEFLRYWLIDPTEANRRAPNTVAEFETILDSNPDIGNVMRQARDDIQVWRNAPDEGRIGSHIISSNPNGTKYGISQLTRDVVDDLHVLRLAVDDAAQMRGRTVAPSDNPYLLARNLRGSYGMADTFIRDGVVDFKTKAVTLGNSLKDALAPISGDRMQQFRRWIVAMRARELHDQGRSTGLLDADVRATAARYETDPVFQTAFAKIKAWSDAVLQYAVDAGLISTESAANMRAMNADYVPFHRLFEIGAGESPSIESGGIGRGLNVGKPGSLKSLKGSQRPIIDPLETLQKNAYAIITAAEKANISAKLADLANSPGMGKWVEKIATPKERVQVGVEKIRQQLEAAGADMTAVPDTTLISFFQNSGTEPFGQNIIRVIRNGKPEFYRLQRDLFDTFHALDLEDAGKLIRLFSGPTQLLRAGVILDPAFSLANIIRDNVGSAVINRYGMLPFEAAVRGIGAMIGNPKLVAEWRAAGGENAIESTFFDQAKLRKYMREKITKELTPAERALIVTKSPLVALRWLTGMAETATRIGEYGRAYNEAIKRGMPEGDARRIAAFESRDRQDFAKGGAKTKAARSIAAFWNAALQGNTAFYQAVKNRPLRTVLQGLAFITIPKMIEQALNWDDKDYWDRPQWERDGFFLIPIGKDANNRTRFLRFPIPFLPGVVFGTLPGRMMQWQKQHNNSAMKGLLGNVMREVVPNPAPQSALTIAEMAAGRSGYSFFRGRPIVPESIVDLPAEMQWTEQTSLTAKKLGKVFGVSPMKVDYAIASTTGGLGKQVTHNLIDRVISMYTHENPTAVNIIPGMRFLTTPAGISSQTVEDFYQELIRLRGLNQSTKLGETVAPNEIAKLQVMEAASDRISQLRKQARAQGNQTDKQKLYLKIVDEANSALNWTR